MKFATILLHILFLLFLSEFLIAQNIVTFAGNGSTNSVLGQVGDGGLATNASVLYPTSVCMDSKGNLFIASVNMVRKVAATTNIITTIAGNGTSGYSGDGGLAANAMIEYAYCLCIDLNDNIYFTEYVGHRIREINNNGIITTIAGTGSRGFSGDGGLATNASLNSPRGICCDANGNIYFCDADNSRIRKIDQQTGIITTIAGSGSLISDGDGGLAINAGTPYPVALCFDKKGGLVFTEVSIGNSCKVRRVDTTTKILNTIAGNDKNQSSGDGSLAINANLFDPTSICIDNNNNIYVAEFDDSRIRKIDANTLIISTVAGNGVNAFSGDGGPAINASMYGPQGLMIDGANNLFIADNLNNRVRKVNQFIVSVCSPVVTVSASATSICKGTEVTFSAFVNNGSNAAPTYQWLVNGNIEYTGGASFSTTALKNNDIIYCIYTSTSGCIAKVTSTNNITMNVSDSPVIHLTTDTVVYFGNKLLLNAVVVSSSPVTYQWIPNVWLDNDTIATPLSTPQSNITYQLQILSSNNCKANASIKIEVLNLKIPNAFSPNGDNINDTWVIKGLADYQNCTVEIFNRYGQSVFHSIGYNQPWDGTYKGKPLPIGTYFYIINPKNGIASYSGSITILR